VSQAPAFILTAPDASAGHNVAMSVWTTAT
jgi:hypothetical protein